MFASTLVKQPLFTLLLLFHIHFQDFRLPAYNVYKTVADELATKQKFNEIQVLLSNAIQTRLMGDKDHDNVVISLLGMLTDDDRKVAASSGAFTRQEYFVSKFQVSLVIVERPNRYFCRCY